MRTGWSLAQPYCPEERNYTAKWSKSSSLNHVNIQPTHRAATRIALVRVIDEIRGFQAFSAAL